jgi:hypothetical protein
MSKPQKSYALWIAGHCLRALATLLIFTVCALVLWRVFISGNPPKEMNQLAVNDALQAAYDVHGDALELYTQEQASVTRGEHNYGYFGITRCIFIPQADQVQITFRYNNSTLEEVQNDLNLPEEPPRGVEIFDVSLVTVCDTTPEDKSDNTDGSASLAQSRIAPTARRIDTTLLYTYIHYTFDGVEITSDTITAFFDIYYGEPDYTAPAMGTLRLYHYESVNLPVELTRAERKALGGE